MGMVPMGMGNTAMVGTGTVLPKTGVALVVQERAWCRWNGTGHGTSGTGMCMALVEWEQAQHWWNKNGHRWNGNGQGPSGIGMGAALVEQEQAWQQCCWEWV